MKITKDMVETVLKSFPDTRDSDLRLGNKICECYDIYLLMSDWVTLGNLISRQRRKFQQMGMYLPTDPKIKKRRGQLREEARKEYRTTKKDVQMCSLKEIFGF